MPSKPSMASEQDIRNERRQGIYTPENVRDEASCCYAERKADDVCFTLITSDPRRNGYFGMVNAEELVGQLKLWKKVGAVSLKPNIKERTLKCGNKVWMVVIQERSMYEEPFECDASICPLALAHSFMVTGFTFMFFREEEAVKVWRAMGSYEAYGVKAKAKAAAPAAEGGGAATAPATSDGEDEFLSIAVKPKGKKARKE